MSESAFDGLELHGGWVGAMGMRFVVARADLVELEWRVGPEHLQPFGLVHGGVHSGAIETACSVGASIAASAAVVGVENHTSFLRPAREGLLKVAARPVHVGKKTQLWEASVTDEQGRTLATGRVRLMLAS